MISASVKWMKARAPREKDAGSDRREDPISQHLPTGRMLQKPNFRRRPVFHTENKKNVAQGLVK
ncbi:hypothetical protein LRP31_12170 [Mesorhizobium mediterraneum]|nr:hypothetical protein [Mesorhizobium mediterraneum]RWN40700.1 MAG: hypothetical protein EOR96_14610 [Mesorhizobium sp.]WIW55850.1 hypothetical protein LRP31_12170 [Mesorhizobium mediterraneum]